MKGATSSAAGKHGLVPAPAAGKQGQFLRGDGTWQTPPYPGTASTSSNGLMTSTMVSTLNSLNTKIGTTDISAVGSTVTEAIRNLNSNLGSKVIVDGEERKDLRFRSVYYDKDCGELPYEFYDGSAVVYNYDIHILGTNNNTTDCKKHYKWNGA